MVRRCSMMAVAAGCRAAGMTRRIIMMMHHLQHSFWCWRMMMMMLMHHSQLPSLWRIPTAAISIVTCSTVPAIFWTLAFQCSAATASNAGTNSVQTSVACSASSPATCKVRQSDVGGVIQARARPFWNEATEGRSASRGGVCGTHSIRPPDHQRPLRHPKVLAGVDRGDEPSEHPRPNARELLAAGRSGARRAT